MFKSDRCFTQRAVLSHFSVWFEAFIFKADAIGKLFEEVNERTKKQIWYYLVYKKTTLLDENFNIIPASTDTTNAQVYVVEFEWNRRALFTPFFLIWFLKKINSSFWRVKGSRNVDYDKDVCNPGLLKVIVFSYVTHRFWELVIFVFVTWEHLYGDNICSL